MESMHAHHLCLMDLTKVVKNICGMFSTKQNPAVSTLAIHCVNNITDIPLDPKHVRSVIDLVKQLAKARHGHCSIVGMQYQHQQCVALHCIVVGYIDDDDNRWH